MDKDGPTSSQNISFLPHKQPDFHSKSIWVGHHKQGWKLTDFKNIPWCDSYIYGTPSRAAVTGFLADKHVPWTWYDTICEDSINMLGPVATDMHKSGHICGFLFCFVLFCLKNTSSNILSSRSGCLFWNEAEKTQHISSLHLSWDLHLTQHGF